MFTFKELRDLDETRTIQNAFDIFKTIFFGHFKD